MKHSSTRTLALLLTAAPTVAGFAPLAAQEEAERSVVAPFARLGAGVVLRPGAMVGHHNRIGDGVYIAPGAVLSGFCEVGPRAFIGTGALLRDHVRIGADVTVGMGSVVTSDLTEPGVYLGAPARPKPPASQAA